MAVHVQKQSVTECVLVDPVWLQTPDTPEEEILRSSNSLHSYGCDSAFWATLFQSILKEDPVGQGPRWDWIIGETCWRRGDYGLFSGRAGNVCVLEMYCLPVLAWLSTNAPLV
jgi:hypothetical protein